MWAAQEPLPATSMPSFRPMSNGAGQCNMSWSGAVQAGHMAEQVRPTSSDEVGNWNQTGASGDSSIGHEIEPTDLEDLALIAHVERLGVS